MPSPPAQQQICIDALRDMRMIMTSIHKDATPAEKLVRIAWVIGRMPESVRDAIIGEARNRVVAGWAAGLTPTDWGK
jgi:hypothetical protein